MKTYLGKNTINKILIIIKNELSKRIHEDNESNEDDVRRLWNEITGADLPNTGVLSHNHDDIYSKLDHNHDSLYSNINHNHDERYYTKDEVITMVQNLQDRIAELEALPRVWAGTDEEYEQANAAGLIREGDIIITPEN